MKLEHYIIPFFLLPLLTLQGVAEEIPTALDLCKKMYESRMAIDEMKANVTIRKPVISTAKPREKETIVYLLQCSGKQIRSDKTDSFEGMPKSRFAQYIQTPSMQFFRNPYNSTGRNNGDSTTISSKIIDNPKSYYDPRQIGLVVASLDVMPTTFFDFDSVTETFYPPNGVDFKVERDVIEGDNLWKVSYRIEKPPISNSYWIDDQKGYNLVRVDSQYVERDCKTEFIVTLQQHKSRQGDIWFPKKTVFSYRNGENDIMKEEVLIDKVSFKIDDDNAFTLAGLNLPIGHEVLVDGDVLKYWDGKSLVDFIPHAAPRPNTKKYFWIINGILLVLIALAFYRQSLRRRSDKQSL